MKQSTNDQTGSGMTVNDPKIEADYKERSEMIARLLKALDQFAPTKSELWDVIHSIWNMTEFMQEQRFCHDSKLMVDCNMISEAIRKAEYTMYVDTFQNIAQSVSWAVNIAGKNAEGISILNKLEPAFRVIMGYSDEPKTNS